MASKPPAYAASLRIIY